MVVDRMGHGVFDPALFIVRKNVPYSVQHNAFLFNLTHKPIVVPAIRSRAIPEYDVELTVRIPPRDFIPHPLDKSDLQVTTLCIRHVETIVYVLLDKRLRDRRPGPAAKNATLLPGLGAGLFKCPAIPQLPVIINDEARPAAVPRQTAGGPRGVPYDGLINDRPRTFSPNGLIDQTILQLRIALVGTVTEHPKVIALISPLCEFFNLA